MPIPSYLLIYLDICEEEDIEGDIVVKASVGGIIKKILFFCCWDVLLFLSILVNRLIPCLFKEKNY